MRYRKAKKKSSSVNLTPMIDVVFQLLIFYMVSSNIIVNPGIKLNLPQATTANTETTSNNTEIKYLLDF